MKQTSIKKKQIPLKKTPLKKVSSKQIIKVEKERETKRIQREEDIEFYEMIWKKRNHKSDLTGNFICGTLLTSYFHHLLPKSIFKNYRHCEWNILLCEDFYHSQIEINPSLLPKEIKDRLAMFLNIAIEQDDKIRKASFL